MPQPIYTVDAFTDRAFAGNPAAVCPMHGPGDEAWMKHVAAEMNLSETAFLYPEAGGWHLRWLTPAVEVKLCGHATLASAHVLWETERVPAGQAITFHTKSGKMSAERRGAFIELDFPARPPKPCPPPDGLLRAIGCESRFVGRDDEDYFVEVADEEVVRRLTPDHVELAKLPVRGVIVTGRPTRGNEFDFVSRFFAPGSGIPEDPVTGSAHCALGPFWGERSNKTDLVGYQASPRGGIVRVSLRGDRVKLAGLAVTIMRGELLR